MFAVWYYATQWKYKVFDSKEDALEWYHDFRRVLPWDELDYVERPVPFVDGRPVEREYNGPCKGQISMFD